MSEAGVEDRPCTGIRVNLDLMSKNDDLRVIKIRATAMGCIALAAMQRVLRKSKFDDILDFMDFFRLDLEGEWTSFIETSKELAELILDFKAGGAAIDMDEEEESLKSFRSPFLALAAQMQEPVG